MKKNIQPAVIFNLLLTLLLFSSCSDILDVNTYSKITNEHIEDSDKGADMWVMGAYNGLSRMYVYDEFPRCLELDNDYVTGPSWAFSELGAGNFQGLNNQSDAVWKLSYDLINRTNEAIYHIEEMKNVTEVAKNNCLGELYFLQAYGYFLLVRAYGAVPIFKTSINQGNDPNQPRQSIPTVYAHIINLLSNAKEMIYKNTNSSYKEGRVSAGAAASLLAKVYATIGSASMPSGTVYVRGGIPFVMNGATKELTQPQRLFIQKQLVAGYESFDYIQYYTLARDLAKEVMDKQYGDHELLPYESLWKKSGRNSKEHFFALQTKSGDDYFGALFARAYSGQIVNGYVPNGGGLSHGLRDHWYKLFEDQDLRIVEGVMHRYVRQSDMSWNGGAFYPNTEEWRIKATGKDNAGNKVGDPVPPFNDGRSYGSSIGENYLAYVTKYTDVTDRSLTRTDAMLPLLRYTDLVLIFAEASNEVDGLNNEALAALNSVRARSNASIKTMGTSEPGSIESIEEFRSAVLEERAMELAYESDRRWDLIRWGIYLGVMNGIGTVDEINTIKMRESKHLLYPIPQDELLANQAITENNPGWQ
ncbi:RagB/SusD family nutrient uptake outer membrane protein [uncultured Proteiniphilum sp.]|uniref:RagB/SusD family nutrient uptake outer membrane protein n=1 Tax=uncultured Proteiniphilum sp. TaxID=497637 RepID=UPI00261596E0|nr:RagB/SusD family nutrient uptake outer membrane protein [uncultured Proteiniphilum sp.]